MERFNWNLSEFTYPAQHMVAEGGLIILILEFMNIDYID